MTSRERESLYTPIVALHHNECRRERESLYTPIVSLHHSSKKFKRKEREPMVCSGADQSTQQISKCQKPTNHTLLVDLRHRTEQEAYTGLNPNHLNLPPNWFYPHQLSMATFFLYLSLSLIFFAFKKPCVKERIAWLQSDQISLFHRK